MIVIQVNRNGGEKMKIIDITKFKEDDLYICDNKDIVKYLEDNDFIHINIINDNGVEKYVYINTPLIKNILARRCKFD